METGCSVWRCFLRLSFYNQRMVLILLMLSSFGMMPTCLTFRQKHRMNLVSWLLV